MHRVVLLAALAAFVSSLPACSNFDPDKLDVFGLNEKKKLPGERKEMFPGGVPGVTQGIPPEYMKGNQPPPDVAQTPAAEQGNPAAAAEPGKKTAAVEPEPQPKPKRKPKPHTVSQPPRAERATGRRTAASGPVAAAEPTAGAAAGPGALAGAGAEPGSEQCKRPVAIFTARHGCALIGARAKTSGGRCSFARL